MRVPWLPLGQILVHPDSPNSRDSAAQALFAIGTPEAHKVLAEYLFPTGSTWG